MFSIKKYLYKWLWAFKRNIFPFIVAISFNLSLTLIWFTLTKNITEFFVLSFFLNKEVTTFYKFFLKSRSARYNFNQFARNDRLSGTIERQR